MGNPQKQRAKQAEDKARKGQRAKPDQALEGQQEQVAPGALGRAVADPQAAAPGDIAALQGQYGNRAVSGLIQPKLRVGPAGDAYEQEADRVADRVLSSPAPAGGTPVQRQTEDEDFAQRQARPRQEDGFDADGEVERRIAGRQGSGRALPAELRADMESRFGADFEGVRLHADGEADDLNRRLSARAFTHEKDIYFAAGEYDPGSSAGRRLLAHELTHVVQQGGAPPQPAAAPALSAGVNHTTSGASAVQRKEAWEDHFKKDEWDLLSEDEQELFRENPRPTIAEHLKKTVDLAGRKAKREAEEAKRAEEEKAKRERQAKAQKFVEPEPKGIRHVLPRSAGPGDARGVKAEQLEAAKAKLSSPEEREAESRKQDFERRKREGKLTEEELAEAGAAYRRSPEEIRGMEAQMRESIPQPAPEKKPLPFTAEMLSAQKKKLGHHLEPGSEEEESRIVERQKAERQKELAGLGGQLGKEETSVETPGRKWYNPATWRRKVKRSGGEAPAAKPPAADAGAKPVEKAAANEPSGAASALKPRGFDPLEQKAPESRFLATSVATEEKAEEPKPSGTEGMMGGMMGMMGMMMGMMGRGAAQPLPDANQQEKIAQLEARIKSLEEKLAAK
ncbi:MAG: DUF4157 domain-containing protein [Anaerolineae bacterium]|jgi:hypothetical protein